MDCCEAGEEIEVFAAGGGLERAGPALCVGEGGSGRIWVSINFCPWCGKNLRPPAMSVDPKFEIVSLASGDFKWPDGKPVNVPVLLVRIVEVPHG